MKYILLVLLYCIFSFSLAHAQIAPTANKPDSQILSPNGLDTLEKDLGSLNGRKLLQITHPNVTKEVIEKVSQEASEKTNLITITYHFEIMPDGSVGKIFKPISKYPSLVKVGISAIKKWRFTPITNTDVLKTSVTINFRLD